MTEVKEMPELIKELGSWAFPAFPTTFEVQDA